MADYEDYLGDGCYVEFEGGMVKLWTSDGVGETNRIYFEPETLATFLNWLEKLRAVTQKREEQQP